MTETIARIHPFQAAGLGIAPFRFAGHYESTFQAAPGEPARAGSSCDYCGTAIRDCFKIRSADGREFKVGCDCVEKTCQPGGPIMTAAQKAAKKVKKQREAAKLIERIADAKTKLTDPTFLTDRFSPWGDGKGGKQTVRQMVEFLLERGGAKGKTDACKIIERAA